MAKPATRVHERTCTAALPALWERRKAR